MQILYIAREPIDAQSAAALRAAAPDAEVHWVSRFDEAGVRIDEHCDLAALLVDTEVDDQGCATFLTDVRRRGFHAPVVVIAPEESRASIESLHAGADDCAMKSQSFPRALSEALIRAIARARTLGAGRWDHLSLDSPHTPTHSIDSQSDPALSGEAVAHRLAKCQAEVEATISHLFSEGNAFCNTLASRLSNIEPAFEAVERELIETRTAAEAAERLLQDEKAALAVQAERLEDQIARERAEYAGRLAEMREQLETANRVSSTHAAALTRKQIQLDESRALARRQFEESPWAICRCTRDGTLMDANRAFTVLVGHASVDELRKADFGEAVFESAADLPWLIERSLKSAGAATIETTWRTKEGSRLTVQLSASAQSPDAIEIVAEDLTSLRALQERLGPAQRMEAVGRLASEVAVTCANVLSDVHRDAESWLRTVATDTSLRHQGEMLLDEVTRAGGFLRQLAAYGDEQTIAVSTVELNKMLRDFGPVLKRVAGDDVELELPRTMAPLTVDVRSDRVEKLLVNLASYGRERMPFGGRLKIELATVIVDQAFIEKYPNVRRGPHALITVTEIRRTTRAEGPLRLREWPAETEGDRESSGSLGVDLGALQGLIRECGGHLWVTAVPHGDMVVQIRLPLCSEDARKQPRPQAPRASLGLTGSSMVSH